MNDLRARLNTGQGMSYVGAPSPLFARMIERQGFDGVYLSGAGLANAVLGIPDDGSFSLGELAGYARLLNRATALPIIADADTGFADDDADTTVCVQALEAAGVAGIQIEDQVPAKKCGHLEGKQLVPAEEMCTRLRSAARARNNATLVLIARTDARGVTGYDDALARAQAYRRAGADMIFIEALHDAEEFRRFALDCPGPLMANMTEFGKSALLPRQQLKDFGYTVVIYPQTLLRTMLSTAEQALQHLRENGQQHGLLPAMYTRKQLYELLDYGEAAPEPGHAVPKSSSPES